MTSDRATERSTAADMARASWRTAIARGQTPSAIASALLDGPIQVLGVRRVLDFGCGRAPDWQRYREAGLDAERFDRHAGFDANVTPMAGSFDLVTMVYVVNVLPPEPRHAAVAEAAAYVRTAGRLLVVSRSPRAVEREATSGKKRWPEVFDGYLSVRGFQRGLAVEEIKQLLDAAGMRVEQEPAIKGLHDATYAWGVRGS